MSRPLATVERTRRRGTFERRLPHLCDITRAAAGALDDYGEPTPGAVTTVYAGQPCHLFTARGRGEQTQPERDRDVIDWQMRLPLTVAARATDTVQNVRYLSGELFAAGPFNVLSAAPEPSALLLILEAG